MKQVKVKKVSIKKIAPKVRKHLKHDISESKESIHEDKKLMRQLKMKKPKI